MFAKIILLLMVTTSVNAAVVRSVLLKDASMRVMRSDPKVGDYLLKIDSLPQGTVLEVEENNRLEKPLYGDSVSSLKRSRGTYLGPVTIISIPGVSAREVAEINTYRPYFYRYDFDLAPFLRTKWDWEIPNQQAKLSDEIEWDKVSTKGFWTWTAYQSLEKNGKKLVEKTPKDVVAFCPKYFELSLHEKKIFWINLLSSIAKRESAFDSDVFNDESQFQSGLNAISRGLLQISFSSTQNSKYRKHGCLINKAEDLVNPEKNLACGVGIMDFLALDGCVSCQKNGKWLGIARYWSTLRDPYTLPCASCSTGVANIGKKLEIIEELKNYKTCWE